MRRVAAPACVLAALLAAPAIAQAHLADTGLGPVCDGIAHLLLSLDDLLPVLAMAALAGLNGPASGRITLWLLPLAWSIAGLAAFAAAGPEPPAGATSLSMLVLGILTAADVRLPRPAIAALALALGLLHGWLNGASIAAAGRSATGLAGIAGAIFVLAALGSALVVSLQRPWTRLAVRVAGSWVAAIGMLMLGWTMRVA